MKGIELIRYEKKTECPDLRHEITLSHASTFRKIKVLYCTCVHVNTTLILLGVNELNIEPRQ